MPTGLLVGIERDLLAYVAKPLLLGLLVVVPGAGVAAGLILGKRHGWLGLEWCGATRRVL